MRFAIFALISLSLALAQTPAAAPPPGSLEGTVTQGVTGAPLRRVQVIAISAQPNTVMRSGPAGTAFSDEKGHFLIPDLAPGRYFLLTQKAGLIQPPERVFAQVTSGQSTTGLTLKLLPSGVVSGRVVDEAGDPVPDCQVMAMVRGFGPNRRRLDVRRMAQSDDRGQFRLHGLPPGRYYLQASIDRTGPGGARYPATFHPGTTGLENAIQLEVAAGAEIDGIEIALRPQPTVTVRGVVRSSETSEPVSRIMVQLQRADGLTFQPPSMAVAQEPTGAFSIGNVLPGSYVLTATSAENGAALTARQPITVSRDVSDIELLLRPATTIEARLELDGEPLKQGQLQLEDSLDPFRGARGGRMDRKGLVSIANLTPGLYHPLFYGVDPDLFLESIRREGQEVGQSGIMIDAGMGTIPLTFVFSKKTGTVRMEAPGATAVVLVPVRDTPYRLSRYRQAPTTAKDMVELRGVAPGSYQAYAFGASTPPGAWMDDEYLASLPQGGRSIRVEAGETQTVELKPIP